jgi:hypothetical protein
VRAAKKRLVLSWPRFDSSSGRERVPSSFLLQTIKAAINRRVAAAELMNLASPGQTGLGRPHPEDPDAAIDRIERDLAIVAKGIPGSGRHLLEKDGFVAASIEIKKTTQQKTLTEYDGVLTLAGDEAPSRGSPSPATLVREHRPDARRRPYRHLLSAASASSPGRSPSGSSSSTP